MKRAKKKQKIDTVEKLAVLMQDGFDDVRKEFDDVRQEMRTGFAAVHEDLRWIKAEIVDIHRRLDRLEEQRARQAGYSKEIDYILGRMSRIEKRLKLA